MSMSATFRRLCHTKQGLVLVTGPTGLGESTTLAAMIDHINTTEQKNIVTIEILVEVLHATPHVDRSASARSVGRRAHSCQRRGRRRCARIPTSSSSVRCATRRRCRLALSAAGDGSPRLLDRCTPRPRAETVNRIIDFFPPDQQRQARHRWRGRSRARSASGSCPPPTARAGRLRSR